MTLDQVRKASVWVRKAAVARSRPPDDPALAEAVWAKTKEEIDLGWIQGPFSTGELQDWLGDYVVSRRFGIAQGQDVRVIDDFSESMVNPAFYSPIKARFDGLDEIVSLCKVAIEAVKDDRTVIVPVPGGPHLRGTLHPSLSQRDARSLVARISDLTSAYKQLTCAEATMWARVLLIWNADESRYEQYVTRA